MPELKKRLLTRRGPKIAVSSMQLAQFAHPYRTGDGAGKQPKRWESITKAANKKFGTEFLAAHIKRCYAKHREELTAKTIKKIIRQFRVTENLQQRLQENDRRKNLLHRNNKEPDLRLRRERVLQDDQGRLQIAEQRAASLREIDRLRFNKRFRKKIKRPTKNSN